MFLKSSVEEPVKVFFLTREMLDTLISADIPLAALEKIATYHKQISPREIAVILQLQYAAGERLSVTLPNPEISFGEGVQGGLVRQAFNSLSSKPLVEKIRNTKHFSSIGVGDLVILLLLNEEEEVAGWASLANKTFSSALLEAIFSKVGYLDSHFSKAIESSPSEFSLAHVYRLIDIESKHP